MKNKFLTLFSAFILILGFNACTDDDNFRFQTVENPSQITFLNMFLPEYVLGSEVSSNIAERFIWASPDFGAPTAINYFLETSPQGTFEEGDIEVITTSTETQSSVTIGQMLSIANAKGITDQPIEDEEGNPILDGEGNFTYNNTGELFFRVRADIGDIVATNSPEAISEVVIINVSILLAPQDGPGGNCDFDQLWLVGAGVPDAGWGWDTPVQLPCAGNNVYSGNVLFGTEGGNNFRFFTEEGNWNSGINYPSFVEQGFTIDNAFVDAMDGDNNFGFVSEPGVYFLTVDYENLTITVGPEQFEGNCDLDQLWLVGAGVPDAGWGWGSPVQLPCTGENVYSGNVNFSPDNDGNFRFFEDAELQWASPSYNFPYFVAEGFDIDEIFQDAQDGDNNFQFIGDAGTYFLTVDMINKTITAEMQ